MSTEDSGALDANSAADAFSSLLGGDSPNENESQDDESPEAAAERLAKQDLSGDDDDQDANEPDPDVDGFTVEIDGKTVKLTKEQIAENYKSGLRTKDYTQKTMAAAETVKTAEAETAKARQERQHYAQQLNNFAISTQSGLDHLASELTQELAQNDPQEYLIKQHTLREGQARLAQAQQELGQINQQHQQEQAEAQKTYRAQQWEQLTAKLPAWKDPVKAKAESGAIKEYLSSQGFEGSERDFGDHRAVLLAKKAMEYDALIERAGKAVKKIAPLPTKVERSGTTATGAPDKRTTAMKRLGETGSINDAANAFAALS